VVKGIQNRGEGRGEESVGLYIVQDGGERETSRR